MCFRLSIKIKAILLDIYFWWKKILILINWPDHDLLHIRQKPWYIAGFCICRRGSRGGWGITDFLPLLLSGEETHSPSGGCSLCSLQSDAAALQYHCMCVSQNSKTPHINIAAWATPNSWCIVVYKNRPLLSSGVWLIWFHIGVCGTRWCFWFPSDCLHICLE